MDPHLSARYQSPEGAAQYRAKYDRAFTRRWSNARELRLVARALERAQAHGRLLDCPCGAGRLTPVLLGVAEHVTAVDLSAAMVAQAQDVLQTPAAAGRVDFVVASAERLPFPDAAFDTVVCHRLLHHLGTSALRDPIWRELARVAQRRVIVSFSDASTLKARLQRLRGTRGRRSVLAPEDLAAEARRHGLILEGRPARLSSCFSLVAVALFRVERPRP